MPDYPYECRTDNLLKTYCYSATREAVVKPLGGPRDGQVQDHTKDHTWASRYARTLGRWRRRAAVLRDKGWQSAQTPMRLQVMRNCPPIGLRPETRALICGTPLICPWCFARSYVAKVYRAIEEVLFDGRRPVSFVRPLQLWAYKRTVLLPSDRYQFAAHAREDLLEPDNRNGDLNEFKLLGDIHGAAVFCSVHPWSRGRGSERQYGWMTRRSTLALMEAPPAGVLAMPGGQLASNVWHGSRQLWLDERLRKRQLAKLVAWAIPYPAGMLLANAGQALEILELPTRRMLSRSGLFRTPQIKELAA